MQLAPLIRPAEEVDATSLLAIYAPYVQNTTASFELEAPSVQELAQRIRNSLSGWSWLVAQEGDRIVGYAYASAHRERAAYRWSVETSAYVALSEQRRGIAKRLYQALLPKLAEMGACNAYAGVTLPNDASVGLHRSVGFEPIGTFPRVGRKFGSWHDVAWFHRRLRERPPKGNTNGIAGVL